MVWNPEDYEGSDNIRIPCRKLWLPDIVLYNSVDDYTSGYMPSLAMVYNTGRVFWGPVVRFRSSCKIDITFFPFDDQVCYLKLGSWAYNGYQVDVHKRSETIDLSNYVDNGEWKLIGIKVSMSVLLRKRAYWYKDLNVRIAQKTDWYKGQFLLPPESGEKITLGLSVLLTITVFMLMVADKMPQTSESISLIRRKKRRGLDVNEMYSFREKQEMIQMEGMVENADDKAEYDRLLAESNLNDIDPVLRHYRDKQNCVNELIQWLHRKHNIECIEDVSFQEWRDVAFVMDRLLFVLFLVVTVISTAAILSLRPDQDLNGFTEIKID
ncbi:Neuronal acetylcholine receptor subunit alpha-7 [Mactra antiquata]